MEIVSIPSIATIVYAIVEIYKEIFKSEKAKRAIPIVAGVLGVVAFFACPSIVPTDNAFIAAVMGIFSGLSSVGVNQIGKQLLKKDGEKND